MTGSSAAPTDAFLALVDWATRASSATRAEVETAASASLARCGSTSAYEIFKGRVERTKLSLEWRAELEGQHRVLIIRADPPVAMPTAAAKEFGRVVDRRIYPRVPPAGAIAISIITIGGNPGKLQFEADGSRLSVARVEYGRDAPGPGARGTA